ncbi:MAG: ECF transporter S component [Candidatus Heimdallarchaeota archaeon]|nr:MAG: ECF transporter S component [Candidatus Heimdallarchaeota archaeon]
MLDMKETQDTQYNTKNPTETPSSISHIPWIRSDLINRKKALQYYDTGDLVIIALFSALGGILSTFVGYIGRLINNLLLFPWGAGQIIAGLHIFWIIFIYLLTDRKVGTALLAGIIKGFVEFFTGSAHGILIILISGTQGLVIELFVIIFLSTNSKLIIAIASGFSSTSNVIIQQVLFFNSQLPLYFIAFISFISFISGVIFGGLLSLSMFNLFRKSTILNWKKPLKSHHQLKNIQIIRGTLILILVFCEVGVFSYLAFQNRYSIEVTGNVYNPYTFYISDFPQIQVEAELAGDVTHVPLRNYTGVSLLLVINTAQPKSENYVVKVIASDGYFQEFTSIEILNDPTIILTSSENGIRIVAGNYHGSYWVKMIRNIEIS